MSSLYLHIPFCSSKCSYCDFYSQVGSDEHLELYTNQLIHNIDLLQQTYPQEPPCTTIYFGGGTPSLLTASQIDRILTAVAGTFGIATGAEITLEANPGTVDLQQLKDYRHAGANRLSLGLQSLEDKNLKMLGRRHDSSQAISCVNHARRAGFDNLSLDLIFALPDQTLTGLKTELNRLLALQPEHISIYGLTFEEGTDFERRRRVGELVECSEELYADQYRLIHSELAAADFEHYEISNFARPGRRCSHNQSYWQRATCLAAGPGAHGFDSAGWGERRHIPADLELYAKRLAENRNPAEALESFDREAAMREYFYLALRTGDGVSLKQFEQLFGERAEVIFHTAFQQSRPFLKQDSECCWFDHEGWLLYDHLISAFL